MNSFERENLKLEFMKLVLDSIGCKKVEKSTENDFVKFDPSDLKGKLKFKIDLDKIIEKEKEPWRAQCREGYWFITSNCKIDWDLETDKGFNDSGDALLEAGNYFKTRRQAIQAAKAVKKVLKQKRKEFGLE